MALNFFNKKNKNKKEESKPKKEKAVIAVSENSGGDSFSYQIIKSPHVSEKASNISSLGQYVFRVFEKSNKTEIKKAIERLYRVNVKRVNIIRVPSKKRQVGKYEGERAGYKKAVVILEKGQKIEITPK